uniref:Ribonuclease VapC n=1 Tax=Candidatus Kentrum sp. FM TaxID=2126340 RepID=A0A450T6K6_9GAMM|nr:MAG: ribonuclease VapC [Candidatus Kentron sp. FM]VFJ62470.1 MAG: ribonuclease VapC [Candidatus Kentron sp. FM]VFK12369.1 MAG: ribonuclease VapC [Candidatus Kentron sp. FM]
MKLVADTSAFAAIFFQEPECEHFRRALLGAQSVLVSTATLVELHLIVSHRYGPAGVLQMQRLLDSPLFETVPVDAAMVKIAVNAFESWGKGRHRAGLNFGDLFSYALAKQRGLPLLFKGEDFSETDITPALDGPDRWPNTQGVTVHERQRQYISHYRKSGGVSPHLTDP